MPSTLTDIFRSQPSPPKSQADQARQLEDARNDLDAALVDYANAVTSLHCQNKEMEVAQAEYGAVTSGRSFMSKDEIGIKMSALDQATNVRDQMAVELAKAEESLKSAATHFHGLYFNETQRETERWAAIIDARVRSAAEFHIDGKPLQSQNSAASGFLPPPVMSQVLRYSWPIRQLAGMAPTPIQHAPWEAPRDARFWSNMAGELLQKWDALQKIKARS